MKNILIFGASITHGVGAAHGWADQIKAALHEEMYGRSDGMGEVCQIYELGVPGTSLADILERLEPELKARLQKISPDDTVIILSAGTNDSKAVDAIDNYPFSSDDFAAGVHSFIHLAKDYSNHIIGIGLTPVDEVKTSPKSNPLTGGQSYFANARLQQFEAAFQQTCEAEGVQFVPLFASVPADWATNYLFTDGIHPNQKGHDWIFSQVRAAVEAAVNLAADPGNGQADLAQPQAANPESA